MLRIDKIEVDLKDYLSTEPKEEIKPLRLLDLWANRWLDEDEKQGWSRAQLIIINETSFANKDDMEAIDNKNLHHMCQNASDQEFFGGKHIVFAGDFRQLDPIGKEPLYATYYKLEHKVNSYLELRGNHRFKDDPEWGDLLTRFRDGTIRTEDIQELNKHTSEGGICQEIFHRYFILLFFLRQNIPKYVRHVCLQLINFFFNWTSRLAISYLSTEIPAVGACARFRNNYAIFCSMLYLMNHWYCPGLVGRQVEGG